MSHVLAFLSENSAAMTAIATVVIAVFTFLMWWLSRRIHQATQKRDNEMQGVLKKLTAATLWKPQGAGLEKTVLDSYKKLLKSLDDLETK